MQISGTFAHAVFKISDKDTLRFYLEKDQSDSNWIQQAKFNGFFFKIDMESNTYWFDIV